MVFLTLWWATWSVVWLEDIAPWMLNFGGFTDSPNTHKQETRGLDTIPVTSQFFPWWLLLFLNKNILRQREICKKSGNQKKNVEKSQGCFIKKNVKKEQQKISQYLRGIAKHSVALNFRIVPLSRLFLGIIFAVYRKYKCVNFLKLVFYYSKELYTVVDIVNASILCK